MFKKFKSLVNIYFEVFDLIPKRQFFKICMILFNDLLLISTDIFIFYCIANPSILNFIGFGEDKLMFYSIIIVLIIFKNIVQMINVYFKNKLAFRIHDYITMKMFEFQIFCSNKIETKSNEKEISLVLVEPLNFVLTIFLPIWTTFSDFLTLLFFLIAILIVNFKVAVILFITFVLPIYVIEGISMKIIKINGKIRFNSENNKFKIFRSLVSASDDISIMKLESYFRNKFSYESQRHANSISFKSFKNESVKNVTELLMIFSLLILFIVNKYFINDDFFLLITSLSFVAYRTIPVLNRIIVSLQSINHGKIAFSKIRDSFEKLKSTQGINIQKKTLSLIENITFVFNKFTLLNNKLLFEEKEIILNRGDILIISGKSGSGKSTVLSALINGKGDQLTINAGGQTFNNLKEIDNLNMGSLSQIPFVFPSSILENISLSSLNQNYFENDIYKMLLDKDVESELSISKIKSKNLINEDVLSGGQKQRIGLLRAIFHGEDILIFDEPTSALDNYNKKQFMDILKIISKNNFIIMVSHDQEIINLGNKVLKLN